MNNMRRNFRQINLQDFRDLIDNLNPNYHAFDIKAENWKKNGLWGKFKDIFRGQEQITLTRFDLRNTKYDIEEFILKVLLWGYPTVGRGNNIKSLLEPANFIDLTKTLQIYRENEISHQQLEKGINRTNGLGISTMSKFAHFLNASIEGYPALILDTRLTKIINSNRFVELEQLNIKEHNITGSYVHYLKLMHEISKDLGVEAGQLELFLFTFGRNLAKPLGEEPFTDID